MSQYTDPVPLFTIEELTTAFSLLLPKSRAAVVARGWFDTFAVPESVDGAGRYLYRDWLDDPDMQELTVHQPILELALPIVPSDAGMFDYLAELSSEEMEERLMMFSDFLLDLVALSSPRLLEQVKVIRKAEVNVSTEYHCRELQRAIDRRNLEY
jgi:hypothetical protein